MANANWEHNADIQIAEGKDEGVCPMEERRVTKHAWRVISGDDLPDTEHNEPSLLEVMLTQELSPVRITNEGQDELQNIPPEHDGVDLDRRSSVDTNELIETVGRLAMQASVLTDQLSAMATQLVDAERAQAKAERAGVWALAKLKVAEARLAEQERQHQSELEMLCGQYQAKIADAEAAGEHYLAQLQAFGDRALAEIAGLKGQRDQALAALTAFRDLPWWRRVFAPETRSRTAA